MNFDLSDLRAFVCVADLGSFRAAAEALHLSQPALSRRVDKLEQALGFRLFERTTRKVDINAMGRAFLPRARHVLGELESALLGMVDLSARIHGLVTVACIPTAVDNFISGVVRDFHRRLPGIRVRLLDQPAPDILLSVARSEADFGITYLGLQEPDLEFERLVDEPFVLACRGDHPGHSTSAASSTPRKRLTPSDNSATYIPLRQPNQICCVSCTKTFFDTQASFAQAGPASARFAAGMSAG